MFLRGLIDTMMKKQQNLQNIHAHIVARTSWHIYTTPLLKELHWLAMKHHVQYKVLVCGCKRTQNLTTVYLGYMVQVKTPDRIEMCQGIGILLVPRIKTMLPEKRSCINTAQLWTHKINITNLFTWYIFSQTNWW